MIRIAHVSDLHVWGYEPVAVHKLLNKRLVGGVNIALNRNAVHQDDLIVTAFADINAAGVDHICVSGDLTNLALPGEFSAARELLREVGCPADKVSIIPGNHDYYTSDAVSEGLFEKTFKEYLSSELPQFGNRFGYPFVRTIGDVALISLSSAVPSPPLFAYGRAGREQLTALQNILAHDALAGKTIVAQIHHHLLPYPHSRFEAMRDLHDAPDLLRLLRQYDVALVMHGHNHDATVDTLPTLGTPGRLVISGSGSTSTCRSSKPNKIGSFKIYDIANGAVEAISTHFYEPTTGGFSRVEVTRL